jgi:hypothetical protein
MLSEVLWLMSSQSMTKQEDEALCVVMVRRADTARSTDATKQEKKA